jgi:mono/diheme cytochrome c family protein
MVCPGILGGVEWNGPAYDRLHHAVVTGSVDWCSVITRKPETAPVRGEVALGGTWTLVSDPPASGWVTSVDPESGKIRWSFHADAPVVSGITPTSGGLVFAGDMGGHLYALDSNDGTVRFKQQTGGAIAGGVISYRVGGRQYVATTSGNISRFVWGEAGLPQIVIYGLGSAALKETKPAGATPTAAAGDPTRGAGIYSRVCVSCHGAAGEGIVGPALKNIASRQTVEAIAHIIRTAGKRPELPKGGAMPSLYPSILSDQDVLDVASFVYGR